VTHGVVIERGVKLSKVDGSWIVSWGCKSSVCGNRDCDLVSKDFRLCD
jgi:hypothetical protein